MFMVLKFDLNLSSNCCENLSVGCIAMGENTIPVTSRDLKVDLVSGQQLKASLDIPIRMLRYGS